jgi:hypothetical protein
MPSLRKAWSINCDGVIGLLWNLSRVTLLSYIGKRAFHVLAAPEEKRLRVLV